MKLGVRGEVTVRVEVNPELAAHWNEKLAKEVPAELPEYRTKKLPLAPIEIRKKKVVSNKDYDRYLRENKIFGNLRNQYIQQELKDMVTELGENELRGSIFTILGVGLARGWDWIRDAIDLGMKGEIYEAAPEGMVNGEEKLRELGEDVWGRTSIFQTEITGAVDEINPATELLIAANFLQILKPTPLRMQAVAKMIGRCIAGGNGRRVVIVHPFPGENKGVLWGDTTPYTLWELVQPIQEGAQRKVRVIRSQDIKYYHHTYTAITLCT